MIRKVFICICQGLVRDVSQLEQKPFLSQTRYQQHNKIVQRPPSYRPILALYYTQGMLTHMPRRACPNAKHKLCAFPLLCHNIDADRFALEYDRSAKSLQRQS